jgi:hypothetical protein
MKRASCSSSSGFSILGIFIFVIVAVAVLRIFFCLWLGHHSCSPEPVFVILLIILFHWLLWNSSNGTIVILGLVFVNRLHLCWLSSKRIGCFLLPNLSASSSGFVRILKLQYPARFLGQRLTRATAIHDTLAGVVGPTF